MKKIKNVIIIGLGAIGTIYAAKLFDYNPECLTVLFDKERLEKFEEEGIFFNEKKYDFQTILDSKKGFEADLVIIATKFGGFESALKSIENFVGDDTIIMSLLNGISSEKIIIEKFKSENVLYSYYIGHAGIKEGNKISHGGIGKIIFNGKKDSIKNIEPVKKLFNDAKIDYEIPDDIESSMWKKFVINIGLNQASAIYRADYGKLQKSEEARKFAYDLMEEAVKIADLMQIKQTETFINEAFHLIDTMPEHYKSSMLQDVEANRKTEVKLFAGEICRLGKIYNVSTPKNQYVLEKLG